MKNRKIRNYIKAHVKEITISTLIVAGAIVGCAISKKQEQIPERKIEILPMPKDSVGEICDLFRDWSCDETVAIVQNLKVCDLGEVGKRLCGIDDITEKTECCVTIEMRN